MRNYNRQGQPVPLTEYEKAVLLTLYYARRKVLLLSYAGLIILIFLGAMLARPANAKQQNLQSVERRSSFGEDDPNAKYASQMALWVISVIILESAVIGAGIYFWYRRVAPLKRDADSGMKERVPYIIVRKEHFPLTNQYFVAFDDPDYLHHQLDERTFCLCNEGDALYIHRAPQSRFVFDQDGRFSIL